MEQWKRNLLILTIGTFITASSFSMVMPFLPLFLLQIGVHHQIALWSGALYSIAYLAGAISAPFWGMMADRYGRKLMIIRAGFVLFFVYFMTAFVTNPFELLSLRLIQGLLSGFIPGATTLIASTTPEKKAGYALSWLAAANAGGTITGPLIGGVIATLTTNRIAFGTAGILVLLSIFLVIFFVKDDHFNKTKEHPKFYQTLRETAHNRQLLYALFLNMVTSLAIMTIEPVITLYISELSHSVVHASLIAGIVFSLTGIASAIFAPLWGRAADRFGFRPILLIGLFGGAVWTFLQLPLETLWWFTTVRFLYGLFFSAVFPSINGLVLQSTSSSFRGRAFGLNQTSNQLGSMLGPLIGGTVTDYTSIHGLFFVTGVFLLSISITSVWEWKKQNAKDARQTST